MINNKMEDLSDIEILQKNLGWLKNKFQDASPSWRKNCQYYSGIVKQVCEKPGQLNNLFDSLQKWLADYILIREGRQAFAGQGGLDSFLKVGLRTIFYFTEVADFFSKNPQYLAPFPANITANLEQAQQAGQMQQQYSEFINIFSSRLIGCDKQLNFLFLDLSKTVKNLTPELRDMQSRLEQKCTSYRIAKLK